MVRQKKRAIRAQPKMGQMGQPQVRIQRHRTISVAGGTASGRAEQRIGILPPSPHPPTMGDRLLLVSSWCRWCCCFSPSQPVWWLSSKRPMHVLSLSPAVLHLCWVLYRLVTPAPSAAAGAAAASAAVENPLPPLSGFGMGLPLSRVYARYFGGDVLLKSMEGFGMDRCVCTYAGVFFIV